MENKSIVIIFDKIEKRPPKSNPAALYPAVIGTKEDGTPYNKFCFNKEAMAVFKTLEKGNRVEILNEQKGENWNIIGAKKLDDEGNQTTTNTGSNFPAKGKGDFRSPDQMQRAAAMRYAVDLFIALINDGITLEEGSKSVIDISHTFYTWLKTGKIEFLPVTLEEEESLKEDPCIEDDDIPF